MGNKPRNRISIRNDEVKKSGPGNDSQGKNMHRKTGD